MKRVLRGILIIGVIVAGIYGVHKLVTKDDLLEAWNLPLSGRVIVIDPGHGGPDGGAGSPQLWEKDITLQVSLVLRDFLQQQGALVLMTRERDIDLADDGTKGLSRRKTEDLHRRLEFVNNSEADLLISIHLNAIPSPKWRGAQTFYSPHFIENEQLAKFIQAELSDNLENTTRSALPLSNIFLLKYSKIVGTLVEIGFLSNLAEKELLRTEDYQKEVAIAIYEGILQYFTAETIDEDLPDED